MGGSQGGKSVKGQLGDPDFVYSHICITSKLLMKDFFLTELSLVFNDKV